MLALKIQHWSSQSYWPRYGKKGWKWKRSCFVRQLQSFNHSCSWSPTRISAISDFTQQPHHKVVSHRPHSGFAPRPHWGTCPPGPLNFCSPQGEVLATPLTSTNTDTIHKLTEPSRVYCNWPVQLVPSTSNSYPALQVHMKLPTVLRHRPLEHNDGNREHSFTSVSQDITKHQFLT